MTLGQLGILAAKPRRTYTASRLDTRVPRLPGRERPPKRAPSVQNKPNFANRRMALSYFQGITYTGITRLARREDKPKQTQFYPHRHPSTHLLFYTCAPNKPKQSQPGVSPASDRGPGMQNKPNFARFWPRNEGRPEKQTQFSAGNLLAGLSPEPGADRMAAAGAAPEQRSGKSGVWGQESGSE